MDFYLKEEPSTNELQKWNSRYDKIYRQVPVELSKGPLA